MPKMTSQNQPRKSSQHAQSSGYLTQVARQEYFLSADLGAYKFAEKSVQKVA